MWLAVTILHGPTTYIVRTVLTIHSWTVNLLAATVTTLEQLAGSVLYIGRSGNISSSGPLVTDRGEQLP